MDEEEEVPTCPLCLEELDATDRAVKACQCGYQVCLWCLHQIRERHNGKCPACRTPYAEENFKISALNHEAAAKEAKERAALRKERLRIEKLKEREREQERANAISQLKLKTNLKHARIVQRNLVYIIGLSLSLAREEVLRRADMFGKFGRIAKVLVNRAHPYNADAPGGPSIAAYVLYFRDQDASNAAKAMDTTVYDGREIRCAIACTKYCDTFVRSGITDMGLQLHCGNPECMYIHEILQSEDVLTREEVLARQLGPPPPAHLFGGTAHRIISPVSTAAATNVVVPPTTITHAPAPIPASRSSGAIPINIPNTSSVSSASTSTTRPAANSNSNRPSNPVIPNGVSPRSVPSTMPSVRRTTGNPSSVPPTTTTINSRRSSPPSSPEGRKRILQNSNNPRSPHGGTGTKNNVTNTSNPPLPTAATNTGGWNAHQHQPLRSLASIHTRSPARSSPLAEENTAGHNTTSKSVLSPLRNINTTTRASATDSPQEKRSPPPGFERVQPKADLPTPARPPGFESMPTPVAKPEPEKPSMGPPPGFGLPPFLQNNASMSAASDNPIHPSMTWSQEASADKVVTPHEFMRGPGTIGPIGTTSTPPPPRENPPGFVDVLGRIGGSLGVTSEVNLKPTGGSSSAVPVNNNPINRLFPFGNNGVNANSNSSSRFGDLLSQANPPVNLNDPSNAYPPPPKQNMFAPSPFGDPATLLNRASSKRSNSRFGFARESSGHSSHSANSAHSAHSNSFGSVNPPSWAQPINPPPSGPQDLGIHLLHGGPVYPSGNSRMGSQRNVNVNNSIGAIGNNLNMNNNGYGNRQYQQQQKTSRFDFAEPPLRQDQNTHHVNQRNAPPPGIPGASSVPFGYNTPLNFNNNTGIPRRSEPPPPILSQPLDRTNDNIVNKFSQMTTADKLASLFNQASWAPGALPPMPQLNTQPKSESQLLAAINNTGNIPQSQSNSGSSSVSSNANNNVNTAPASVPVSTPAPEPTPLPPPGFSKATSEKKKAVVPPPLPAITKAVPVTEAIAPGSPDVASSSDNETAAHKRTRTRREKREKKRKAAASTNNTISSSIIRQRDQQLMSMGELEKEVEAAKARESQLQNKLVELQRRIRSYGKT